ncbi:MAG: type II secretion system F family protein [Chloroflexota bacterium]
MVQLGSILPIAAALAILLVFAGLNTMLQKDIDVSDRINWYRPGGQEGERSRRNTAAAATLTKTVEKAVANRSFATSIARDLARADIKLTVSEFLVVQGLAVIGLFAVAAFLTRNPVFGLLAALVGFYLPRFYVKMLQGRRLKAFNAQLPDTLSLIVNSLRSGYSLLQSMEMVAREAPQPTRDEFYRVVREVSLGLSPEQALNNLVQRIASDDLDLVVTAINVQHEVGGNLAQILETNASTIRDRVRIKGEISVLTAQQRLGGYVISAMPIGLAVILFIINSKYMMQLFTFEKAICMPMIALPICSGLMMLVGFLAIQKIVQIEV